ncbi:MAG: transposase [Pseudomonadota bacterium]
MDHSKISSQSQADIRAHGQIDTFFNRFRIGTLLHQCGIRKRHGHSVCSLTQSIFKLSFMGQNFYRGIVLNQNQPFGKDAAYELLKGVRHNWRKLVLSLARRIFMVFNRLTDDDRESVFIIDDSIYDRSRSKKVELLSPVYDHSTGKYIKGFRMLTLCWSDGASCLPVDFALLSSSDEQKRLCQTIKSVDRRCCAHQRRAEATVKATDHLGDMVKRALKAGLTARYLLMDSWFTMPATVTSLAGLVPVIGMVKKIRTVHYRFQGQNMDLMAIYRRLKKRRGRAKILASTVVTLSSGLPCKLVFVRDRTKRDWLAILSTDIDLPDEEIVRIYGKRWDIEVFFKMIKQHLCLAKEIQCRDFDALIGHTSIVFMRYMFLAYHCRLSTDHRSFGDLFHACCEEIRDISFLEALMRILTSAADRLRFIGSYCQKTFEAFFYVAMDVTMNTLGLVRNRNISFSTNPES